MRIFLWILAFILFCGFIPGYDRDEKLSNKANLMLKRLHQQTMPFLTEVFSTARKPTTDELPQGWAALSQDTTSADTGYWLLFNVKGTIVKTALKEV